MIEQTLTDIQTIRLSNAIEIDIAIDNGFYEGIASARLDGVPFLVLGRGTRPYFITPNGIVYDRFVLRNTDMSADGATIVLDAIGRAAPVQQDSDMFLFPLLAKGNGTVSDVLTIDIAARTERVNSELYQGFAISYAFASVTQSIHWMLESVAIAPRGTLDGAVILDQHMTSNICRLEEAVTVDSTYSNEENYGETCIQAPCRAGGSQLFNLVQGYELAVVTYFESPDALKSAITSAAGEDFVTVADFHYDTLSLQFASQSRVVLAAATQSDTRAKRINRWTAWRDHTTMLWQRALGILPTETLPTIALDGTGAGGIDPGTTYPELLTDWASRMGWLRDQGYRGIVLHTPEWISAGTEPTKIFGGNNCTPFRYQLSDLLGGDAGLKAFCDAAHAHGIKVFVWISGHLSIEAPIWKDHPEWVVRNRGNLIWDGHYHTIHAMSFVHGAREWVASDLRHVREATGVDGVWFDSFTNLALQAINYQSPGREPNAPGVLGFLGDLSAMGYEIMIECMSQLGVSSWGNLRPEALQGQEEMLYDTCLRTYLKDWLKNPCYTRDYYFRCLAARAPLGLWIEEYRGMPAAFPLPLPDWLAPLNLAYAKVEARMRHREVLEDGVGVLWRDNDGAPSALFAYRDSLYHFDVIATDIITNCPASEGIAAGHIYMLSA